MTETQLRIKLLDLEVAALRSVLAELLNKEVFISVDYSEYTQWQKAEAIAEVLNHLRGHGND
jgi:hypothetical protein